jgi:hypothetical protein
VGAAVEGGSGEDVCEVHCVAVVAAGRGDALREGAGAGIGVLQHLGSGSRRHRALGHPHIFGVFSGHGRPSSISEVVAVLVPIIPLPAILLVHDSSEHLDLATKHHREPVPAHGLLDARERSAVAPLVELAAQRVRFELDEPQLARGEEAVAPRGVDVRDGGVDDGGFGGAPDLREVRQQGREVLQANKQTIRFYRRRWA